MNNKTKKGQSFYNEEADVAQSFVDNMHAKPDLSEKMCKVVIEQKRLFGGISLAILKACAAQLEISSDNLLKEIAREKNDLGSDLSLRISLSKEKAQFLEDSYQQIGREPEEAELIFYQSKFVLMALLTHSVNFGRLIFGAVEQHASEETKQTLYKMAEEQVKEVITEQTKANQTTKH